MKCAARRVYYLVLSVIALYLLGPSYPVVAQDPTLARLSFWVPPERMDEFGAAYAEQVALLLKKHGFEASSERGRTTVDSVFNRLFPVETPVGFFAQEQAWRNDEAWQKVARHLGTIFGTAGADSLIRCHFGLYSVPAGPGSSVDAVSGLRRGMWQVLGVSEGLPPASINSTSFS